MAGLLCGVASGLRPKHAAAKRARIRMGLLLDARVLDEQPAPPLARALRHGLRRQGLLAEGGREHLTELPAGPPARTNRKLHPNLRLLCTVLWVDTVLRLRLRYGPVGQITSNAASLLGIHKVLTVLTVRDIRPGALLENKFIHSMFWPSGTSEPSSTRTTWQ